MGACFVYITPPAAAAHRIGRTLMAQAENF